MSPTLHAFSSADQPSWHGYLATHEAYWAVLEAVPVLIAISLFTWFWPSRILTEDSRPGPGRPGSEFIPLTGPKPEALEQYARYGGDPSARERGMYYEQR